MLQLRLLTIKYNYLMKRIFKNKKIKIGNKLKI